MGNKTYNTGRVVGWSAYEEFLKQYPDLNPGNYSEMQFLHNIVYGISARVELSTTAWDDHDGSNYLTKTVKLPGAVYGITPIVSVNYDNYQYKETVALKKILDAVTANIFSCYVSDENGNKVTNDTMTGGYITFCAYPNIRLMLNEEGEPRIKTIPLIIRGLGVEAIIASVKEETKHWIQLYFGPQGMITGSGRGGGAPEYERKLPINGNPTQMEEAKELLMEPIIDMRSLDPKDYYNEKFTLEGVKIGENDSITKTVEDAFKNKGDDFYYKHGRFLDVYKQWVGKYTESPPTDLIDEKTGKVDLKKLNDLATRKTLEFIQSLDSKESVTINRLYATEDEVGIFTLYQHNTNLPPSLYGMVAGNTQKETNSEMYPIDVCAPYNLKIFDGDPFDDTSYQYVSAYSVATNMPWLTTLFRDTESEDETYVMYEFNQSKQLVPISDDTYASLYGVLQSTEPIIPYLFFQSNDCKYSFFDGILSARRLSGLLSEEFEKDFGIRYEPMTEEEIQAIKDKYSGDGVVNDNGSWIIKTEDEDATFAWFSELTLYEQLRCYDRFGGIDFTILESIPEEDRKTKYYYILRSQGRGSSSQGMTWALIPVLRDRELTPEEAEDPTIFTAGRIDYVDKYRLEDNPFSLLYPWAVEEQYDVEGAERVVHKETYVTHHHFWGPFWRDDPVAKTKFLATESPDTYKATRGGGVNADYDPESNENNNEYVPTSEEECADYLYGSATTIWDSPTSIRDCPRKPNNYWTKKELALYLATYGNTKYLGSWWDDSSGGLWVENPTIAEYLRAKFGNQIFVVNANRRLPYVPRELDESNTEDSESILDDDTITKGENDLTESKKEEDSIEGEDFEDDIEDTESEDEIIEIKPLDMSRSWELELYTKPLEKILEDVFEYPLVDIPTNPPFNTDRTSDRIDFPLGLLEDRPKPTPDLDEDENSDVNSSDEELEELGDELKEEEEENEDDEIDINNPQSVLDHWDELVETKRFPDSFTFTYDFPSKDGDDKYRDENGYIKYSRQVDKTGIIKDMLSNLNPRYVSKKYGGTSEKQWTLKEIMLESRLNRVGKLDTNDIGNLYDSEGHYIYREKVGTEEVTIEGRKFEVCFGTVESIKSSMKEIGEWTSDEEETDEETGEKVTVTKQYYGPGDLKYVNISDPLVIKLNKNNVNRSISVPIPKKYLALDGPLGSIATSGNNQTISLAVADQYNNILPMTGTDGIIPSENDSKFIVWDDLLHWDVFIEALAYNKSIDILGEPLRKFKNALTGAGDNYIELRGSATTDPETGEVIDNPIRLYIASEAPTGNDIPDGSIGIGW